MSKDFSSCLYTEKVSFLSWIFRALCNCLVCSKPLNTFDGWWLQCQLPVRICNIVFLLCTAQKLVWPFIGQVSSLSLCCNGWDLIYACAVGKNKANKSIYSGAFLRSPFAVIFKIFTHWNGTLDTWCYHGLGSCFINKKSSHISFIAFVTLFACVWGLFSYPCF